MNFDKFMDKLGIYDIFGVILPGFIMSAGLVLTLYWTEVANVLINNGWLFIILSYFLGQVFLELGFSAFNIFTKNDWILDKVFLYKSICGMPKHLILFDDELMKTKEYIFNNSAIKDNNYCVYNYCKYRVGNSHEKDKAIASMSRSLSVYCLIMAIISVIFLHQGIGFTALGGHLPGAFFVLALLFTYRTLRYTALMYFNVLKRFYYTVVLKEGTGIDNAN